MKQRILAFLMILCVMAWAAAGQAEPAAEHEPVEAIVRGLLNETWLADGAAFACEPGDGLWHVHLTRDGAAAGEMALDGDWEDFVALYQADGYSMPDLKDLTSGRAAAAPEDRAAGDARLKEAETIFARLRGGELLEQEFVRTEYRLSGQDWVYGLEMIGEQMNAVLILRVPEEGADGGVQLMAYVDLDHNWDVRYTGCLSIGEAYELALKAVAPHFEGDAAEYLQMENASMVLGQAENYSMDFEQTGIAPEVPFWTVSLLDMRAWPESTGYDEAVEIYRYHVLLNPFNGDVLETWTEDFGWG